MLRSSLEEQCKVKGGKVNSKSRRVKIGSDEKKREHKVNQEKSIGQPPLEQQCLLVDDVLIAFYVENTRKILIRRKT